MTRTISDVITEAHNRMEKFQVYALSLEPIQDRNFDDTIEEAEFAELVEELVLFAFKEAGWKYPRV